MICILAALANIPWLSPAIRDYAGLPLIRSLIGPGEARALDASVVLAVGAAVAVAVLVLLMLVAWHQASSLVIDIADILIERNRRKEFQAPPQVK